MQCCITQTRFYWACTLHLFALSGSGRGQEGHQPRVGDGRKLGSPDSKEPTPVQLDNGEPLPLDEAAVAKHQKRLNEKEAQRSARHENAHSDEFALSGDQDGAEVAGQKGSRGVKEGRDEKPVYVDPAPLAALLQVLLLFLLLLF